MKRNSLRLAAALTVILAASYGSLGCPPPAPGQDAVLVNAQRTFSNAYDSLDLLFELEYNNRDLIESKLPGTHKIVDGIKVQAKGTCGRVPKPDPCNPGALRSLLSAIDTYTANRDKTDLDKWEAVVKDLLNSAKQIIASLASQGIKAEVGPLQDGSWALQYAGQTLRIYDTRRQALEEQSVYYGGAE